MCRGRYCVKEGACVFIAGPSTNLFAWVDIRKRCCMLTWEFFPTCMFGKNLMLTWENLMLTWENLMLTWDFLMSTWENLMSTWDVFRKKISCWHWHAKISCQHAIFFQTWVLFFEHACLEKHRMFGKNRMLLFACWHAIFNVNMRLFFEHAIFFRTCMFEKQKCSK